jgi:PAS domain-containing protein
MIDAIPLDYLVFLFTAPVLLLIMFFILVFRIRKPKPETNTMHLNLFVLCCMGFLLMNFLEFTAFSREWTLFWARASYPFFVFLPSLWFILILRLTSGEPRLPILAYSAVFLIPLVTLILICIDSCRPLIWTDITYRLVGPFTVMEVRHGVWFAVYAVHTYALALAGVIIFVLKFRFRNRAFAFKSVFVILGIAIPLLPSVIYVFDLFPGLSKDFTPVGYGVSGLFFAFGIFKKQLFSMVPFARSILVEQMQDGIVVLDRNGFIVDINPSALQLFQMAEKPLGLLFEKAADFPEEVKDIARVGEAREIAVPLMTNPAEDSKMMPLFESGLHREENTKQGVSEYSAALHLSSYGEHDFIGTGIFSYA